MVFLMLSYLVLLGRKIDNHDYDVVRNRPS